MSLEEAPIHVTALMSVLEGKNPGRFMGSLLKAGYDRFYVRVPEGFWASHFAIDPYPPGYQLLGSHQPVTQAIVPTDDQPKVGYVQLDSSQVRGLMDNRPIALRVLGEGYLESVEKGGTDSDGFKYRKGVLGGLLPLDASVARQLPKESDADLKKFGVVRHLGQSRRQHSYILHGVTFKDVFVEESAWSEALDRMQAREDLPDDPYGLKEAVPLVYGIFCKAYQNRGKRRRDIDRAMLAMELKNLNATYEKDPMPFKNKRENFAANLANPTYRYDREPPKLTEPIPKPVTIQSDEFLDQGFINKDLKKVLYAACCWIGRKEPSLDQDPMKLVNLLRGLGYRDAKESDPVQSIMFFITKELVDRRFPATDYLDEDGGER